MGFNSGFKGLNTLAAPEILYIKSQYTYTTILQTTVYSLTI